MRIFYTVKNSLYAVISYILLAVLALLVRKVFLQSLPIELLGYEGLFSNIFSLLSLADLGIESLILYRMFPAFANNDEDDINKNMSVYKLLYKWIGIAIFAIGIMLIPFLRYIISGSNLEWSYVYCIYFFQLAATLCTYFLAYKRLLFTVSQQEYVCTKIDTLVSSLFNIVKIAVLIILKSYIAYILCSLVANLLSNIIISKKVNESFSYYDSRRIASRDDIRKLGLKREIKDNLVQKISGTIYGGTDNIIISTLLGIESVGLLSNYSLISNYVTSFFMKLLKPFQMAIGNYVYTADEENGYRLFRMFDFLSFLIASVVAICYLNVFNPFIHFWLGEKYILGELFVLAFSCNQYALWNHQFLCFYRYSFGKYELDKKPILYAAIANILLSIALCNPFGVAGVMTGTTIGQIGFWMGRVRVVYSEYIHEKIEKYVIRQGIRMAFLIVEMWISRSICSALPVSIFYIMIRLMVSITLPCVINLIIFYKSSEMKGIMDYYKKTLVILRNKGNKDE